MVIEYFRNTEDASMQRANWSKYHNQMPAALRARVHGAHLQGETLSTTLTLALKMAASSCRFLTETQKILSIGLL